MAANFHRGAAGLGTPTARAKRISTFKLATELLYINWLDKGKSIAVTSSVAAAAKLSARSKSNALAELEQLGLISIDRSVRRSPRVTLLLVPKG
jgi:hypothetical protein